MATENPTTIVFFGLGAVGSSMLIGFSELAELLEPGDEQRVLVDVTPVNRTRNFHNFSLETPEFFNDLFLRLTGLDLPQSRELYISADPGKRALLCTDAGALTP